MEEDVEEEINKTVKSTESQKSVTTSNMYSTDFTDYNSDKNYSSGKETYVIDWYDSDDSEESCRLHQKESAADVTEKGCKSSLEDVMQCADHQISNSVLTSPHKVSFIAQETFTQTSKTIIELARSEGLCVKSTDINTLQTQTSYVSITDSKIIEYKVFSSGVFQKNGNTNWRAIDKTQTVYPILSNCLEDKSSKFPESESDGEKTESENSMNTRVHTQKNVDETHESTNKLEISMTSDSDIDDDSLMEFRVNNKLDEAVNSIGSKNSYTCDTSKSIGNEVEELYDKVSNCLGILRVNKNAGAEFDSQWTCALTPLTEESTVKKDSTKDICPCLDIVSESNDKESEEIKYNTKDTKQLETSPVQNESDKASDPFKLPPIQKNKPSSDSLNFLLSADHGNKIGSPRYDKSLHRWDLTGNDLASVENPFLPAKYSSRLPNAVFQLPPIQVETGIRNIYTNYTSHYSSSSKLNLLMSDTPRESININDKIKELKMTGVKRNKSCRSSSPSLVSSQEGSKLCDAALKGCEALCVELLRKLRSTSWCEVLDTLEGIPRMMEKFWNVITELRIADLIRQVTVHVDSPRSQVARTACMTLACILKNTNYTRKPDFYEAVTALLVKTGSFSRPVRRAANMALDDIVCGVDFTHAITALCVHGVGHKSPLVRCAAARLLVVCCAVSGGGRGLLRGRPPSAAAARRAALRALADLLHDKASDARKYAERLYVMLRPLANFEAYFLTDVDVEEASRQMKKYDQLLTVGVQDR